MRSKLKREIKAILGERFLEKGNFKNLSQSEAFFILEESLSESFINFYLSNCENSNDLSFWRKLSRTQKLSEQFLDKHIDKIEWNNISLNQKIRKNEKFLAKYRNKINWRYIMLDENIKLSNKFKLKYKLLGYIK